MKSISKFVLALMLFTATAFSPMHKAQAIAGLATGSVAAVVAGGGAIGTGALVMTYSDNHNFFNGFVLAILGIIILDKQDESLDIRYRALTAEEVQSRGIDSVTARTFNGDLSVINGIRQDVLNEANKKLDSFATKQDLINFIQAKWQSKLQYEESKGYVHPESRLVLEQIWNELGNAAQKSR